MQVSRQALWQLQSVFDDFQSARAAIEDQIAATHPIASNTGNQVQVVLDRLSDMMTAYQNAVQALELLVKLGGTDPGNIPAVPFGGQEKTPGKTGDIGGAGRVATHMDHARRDSHDPLRRYKA